MKYVSVNITEYVIVLMHLVFLISEDIDNDKEFYRNLGLKVERHSAFMEESMYLAMYIILKCAGFSKLNSRFINSLTNAFARIIARYCYREYPDANDIRCTIKQYRERKAEYSKYFSMLNDNLDLHSLSIAVAKHIDPDTYSAPAVPFPIGHLISTIVAETTKHTLKVFRTTRFPIFNIGSPRLRITANTIAKMDRNLELIKNTILNTYDLNNTTDDSESLEDKIGLYQCREQENYISSKYLLLNPIDYVKLLMDYVFWVYKHMDTYKKTYNLKDDCRPAFMREIMYLAVYIILDCAEHAKVENKFIDSFYIACAHIAVEIFNDDSLSDADIREVLRIFEVRKAEYSNRYSMLTDKRDLFKLSIAVAKHIDPDTYSYASLFAPMGKFIAMFVTRTTENILKIFYATTFPKSNSEDSVLSIDKNIFKYINRDLEPLEDTIKER